MSGQFLSKRLVRKILRERDLVLAVQRAEYSTPWSGLGVILSSDKYSKSIFHVFCDDGLVRPISIYDIVLIGKYENR